ncbi:MAG TPA: hypothetical protein VIB98_10015 [Gemmatimonadaceae bacterium]|jgi:hypothetical protein
MKIKLSVEKTARLAGLGALAVSGALVAVYVLFFWFIAYRGVGIDAIESAVARISVGLVFLALIGPHIVFGRILLASSRSEHTT